MRFLAVNRSWELVPWADVVYACDGAWWKLNRGLPQFGGLKLTQDSVAAVTFEDVHRVDLVRKCGDILVDEPGRIGAGSRHGGGNSGFQGLNVVAQFGPRRIALVGFDMKNTQHWHGPHPKGLNNPSDVVMVHWREAMNRAAATLRDLGIEVVNTSPVSALTAFPVSVPWRDGRWP